MNFFVSKLKRPEKTSSISQDTFTDDNIVYNHSFENGLEGWSASYGCTAKVLNSTSLSGTYPSTGNFYACVTKRTDAWQGIEQNLMPRISCQVKYEVLACVRISGQSCEESDLLATLRLETKGSDTKYFRIGSVKASKHEWRKLQGSFCLESLPERVVFYLEGPSSGVDILVDSVAIRPESDTQNAQILQTQKAQPEHTRKPQPGHTQKAQIPQPEQVLRNFEFNDGLEGWSGRSCKLLLGGASNIPHVQPCSGKNFAIVTQRSQTWHGIEQDASQSLKTNTIYEARAVVRVHGTTEETEVLATLYVKKANKQDQYITIGRAKASAKDWTSLQGAFTLHNDPKRAVIYIECSSPTVDILVDSFSVRPAKKRDPSRPPKFEDPKYGVNIVENSNFERGLSHWHPQGSCSLSVATGAPRISPFPAKESLQHHRCFIGNYVVATRRKFGWEGPAQKLTGKIQLFVSYQASAWVRVGPGNCGFQRVNVALSVDGQWVTCGEAEVSSASWSEIAGSFRLEKKPKDVSVYVQGPDPGVDIMVANLQIFAVDRTRHFDLLKLQAEKLRKRDVLVRVNCSSSKGPVKISVEQTRSNFPIGACINRSNLENSGYVDFFLKNFDYTVFENELKWSWTEPSQGQLNYRDADELSAFCSKNKIPVRGHCVFWEVESCVQGWLKNLNQEQLEAAVKNRISSLASRYKGVFQHYDVNNEMLHGNFFKSRLGPGIRTRMFQLIHQVDPSVRLFVNDYQVEDGRDAVSSPEKYVGQVQALLDQGAPVGGVGIQGHVDAPVGPILRQAFDKLSILGLPIWLTEVDVSSSNDYVRADDLEVVLREAFAHPALEGVVLWGFWEGCCRANGHLVQVDSEVNEAGKRLMSLRKEWQTGSLSGFTDGEGKFSFSGWCGSYRITIEHHGKLVQKCFEVTRGEETLELEFSV